MTQNARPSAAQLGRWLSDGKDALRIAALPLRLWNTILAGRSTHAQRRKILDNLIKMTGTKLVAVSRWLAEHLEDRKATLAGWFSGFAAIAAPSLYAGVLAMLGGVSPAPADVKAANDQVVAQLGYLAGFKEQLRTGAQPLWMTDPATGLHVPSGRLLQRSEMYADAAWSVAQNVFRSKMTRDGFLLERRVLGGETNVCAGCRSQADMGWQLVGVLAPVGSQQCLSKCRCHFVYGHPHMDTITANPLIAS